MNSKENKSKPELNIQEKIDSKELLSGKKEITIIHNQEEYKLRLTSNDKLILTK